MLPSPTTPTASPGMGAQSMLRRVNRRVYAVRYAHREARRAEHFYGPDPPDPHDAPMAMDYFLWAISGDDGPPIVVDAGFRPETAERRGRQMVADPIMVLAALGIDAAGVRDVVLTHLHYDHSGYLAAFPRARFWVQDSELAFWTGRHAARGVMGHMVEPHDVVELVRLNFERRVRF